MILVNKILGERVYRWASTRTQNCPDLRLKKMSKYVVSAFYLSVDTESINFDHHLRCDEWLI